MTTRRQNNNARLKYKPLESRQMLATVAQPAIIVDTIDDVVDATDGLTSLREAVILANSGDGSVSSITFDNSLSGQAISLNTTLPFIEADITFDGDLDDDLVSDITVQGTDLVVDIFVSGVFTVRDADVVFDGLSFEGLSSSDERFTSVIDAARATVSIVNSNFDGNTFSSDNQSTVHSGGLRSVESDIFIDNSSFTNNFGRDAGAIHSSRSTLTVVNSIFEGNSGSDSGVGAITHLSGGDVFVDNSSFVNNVAGLTGGLIISNSADLNNPGLPAPSATISNSVITGNESIRAGGGVLIDGFTAEIINSTISSNITENSGGGIDFRARRSGDDAFSSLTVTNSTISDNTAGVDGGGVTGGGNFVNSTVTGNFSSRFAGGINALNARSFSLENSIVLGNYSARTFGVDDDFAVFIGADIDTEGRNVVGPNSAASTSSLIVAGSNGVFAEVEPNAGNSEILAGVLADNGGTVQTVALLDVFDNPALDVGGLPVGLTTDATGNLRSVDLIGIDNGGTVDAGAFELQTAADFPPVIDGGATATVSVLENTVFVSDINVSDDNDSEGDGITFAITGGADAAAFSIDADTGELQFVNAPDFEAIGSLENSNTFAVEIAATDSSGLIATQTVIVNVTNEIFALTLTLDQDFISENGGSTTVTLTRSVDTSGELTVALTSSDDTRATVPATVVFADGQTEAIFAVTAVDNDFVDDNQVSSIVIAATAGTSVVSASVVVFNDDIADTPPVIDGGATANVDVPENTLFVTNINASDDNDSEGNGVTFAITGGADAAEFSIDADTGELQFVNAPDFEAIGSLENSNTFAVEIAATDSAGLTATQTVTVNVTDEASVLALAIDQTSIAENGGLVTATLTRSGDTSGELTVTLASSDDSAVTVPATVTFADGQTNVTFEATAVDNDVVNSDVATTITATAGTTTATANLTIVNDDVADLPPVIEGGAAVTTAIPENTVFVTDIDVSDDNDSEGNGVTFAITGGADAAAFSIDADTGELQFVNAPDFEAIGSLENSNTFAVEIAATDSAGLRATQTVIVNVTDVLPSLALTIDQASVSENGGVATATLTRSGDTSGELAVSLTSSDATEDFEVAVPATVVFADGQTEATFAVTAVNDDLVDGDQVATITAAAGTVVATATVTVLDDDVAPTDDPLVLGTDGDDTLFGGDGDDILVGGRGSDRLIGSAGDDIFFTDEIDGDINRNDQDVVDLGNLDDNATGNDVIRDFDINEGAENNFDTLDFTFLDNVFSLSTGDDILDFIDFIETDGDRGTDAIQDGNDLIFVFGRDSENPDIITQSVRLEDVIGGRSLTDSDIAGSRINQIGSFESDVFAANGSILFGDASSSSLSGGDDDDVLVGGTGSDVLFGGAGNDVLTGDQTNGGSGGQDQDTFVFGDIDQLDIGNDVITDFDTDNFRGGESNFDTATFTFGGQDFTLDTGFSFILLIRALRDDGNADTEAILDDDDILLVFSRDENGAVTESIRFQDIVGDDGLNTGRLNRNNIGQITNETV